jgi:hypothetical protein
VVGGGGSGGSDSAPWWWDSVSILESLSSRFVWLMKAQGPGCRGQFIGPMGRGVTVLESDSVESWLFWEVHPAISGY